MSYTRIFERLQELGYTEDDFPEDELVAAWDKLVKQPKPLTDRSMSPIFVCDCCFDTQISSLEQPSAET